MSSPESERYEDIDELFVQALQPIAKARPPAGAWAQVARAVQQTAEQGACSGPAVRARARYFSASTAAAIRRRLAYYLQAIDWSLGLRGLCAPWISEPATCTTGGARAMYQPGRYGRPSVPCGGPSLATAFAPRLWGLRLAS